jgi:alkylation response protein AidB-like acyl-CoA dehydrogenase
MLGGMVIGLPPVMNFGSEELKKKVLPEVFNAKKFICLAVTEGELADLYPNLIRLHVSSLCWK